MTLLPSRPCWLKRQRLKKSKKKRSAGRKKIFKDSWRKQGRERSVSRRRRQSGRRRQRWRRSEWRL
jgi:hypothetical protein